MKKFNKGLILKAGRETIEQEYKTIHKMLSCIDDNFANVVHSIASSSGRVIITGIGKSDNISQKIVATLNSTGTPAIFMHAADAIHGDLGIVQPDDVVICMSKSGNTSEIKVLIPLIKSRGNLLIGIVADKNSFLGKSADYILNINVNKEACPNNLVPTSSTTAQLVLGDAIAIALLQAKGFTREDFAKFHPGGSLGKKLYLKVDDVYIQNESPKVYPDADINTIINEISSKRLGATAVVDSDNCLLGIITDGDIRRMLDIYKGNLGDINAKKIMAKEPKTVQNIELAVNALRIIQNNNISQVIVLKKDKYLGMVHFHDLMREGIV